MGEIKQVKTYSFHYYDDRLFELCKEAGEVYTKSLNRFWEVYDTTGVWLSKFELQKEMKNHIQRQNLHSDSFLGAMQQVHANLASWKEAKKVNPEAKAPYKNKFLQPIIFKQSQIKIKGKFLRLTLDCHSNYITLPWNKKIPLPIYGSVCYDKYAGWRINLVVEYTTVPIANSETERAITIDPGVKRIATLFDGDRCITLSGKESKSLVHYRNKTDAEYRSKLSKKEKDSNQYKRLKRGRRKAVCKMQNKQKDLLHKDSRFIVEYAKATNVNTIYIGDNSTTHVKTDCGKKNNQSIQQNPERKLAKYVEQKFKSVSGKVESISERYTSQECPICKKRKKQKNRTYKCKDKNCGFVYDRDGVGAINMYIENVSLLEEQRIRRLTRPFGVKYMNKMSYKYYAEVLNIPPLGGV